MFSPNLSHKTSGSSKGLLGFVAILVSFVFSITVLELAVRARQWIKYGSPTSLQSFTVDSQTGLRIPVANSSTGRITVNSLGFRSPELVNPKPDQTIRLAFLGGSTTWCAEVSSNELTWPHLVWKQLQESYPNITFDYLNAAVPGYAVQDSLVTLENRVKQLRPDVIVVYHATNDISYDTRMLASRQGVISGLSEEESWLGQWLLSWFLIEKNWQLYKKKTRVLTSRQILAFQADELAVGFQQRLEELVRVSRSIAPVVALGTFSYKFRREQSLEEQIQAMNTSLYYMPFMTPEGFFEIFEEYNRVIRETTHAENVILIEAEMSIPGDNQHFNDSVHFKDAGSRVMAGKVVEALVQSPAFKDLLGQHQSME